MYSPNTAQVSAAHVNVAVDDYPGDPPDCGLTVLVLDYCDHAAVEIEGSPSERCAALKQIAAAVDTELQRMRAAWPQGADVAGVEG